MKPQLFSTKRKLRYIPLAYSLVGLFTISPMLAIWLAGIIGNSLGCHINEADTDECVRFGIHFGTFLSGMVVSGWLFFLTIPSGIIFFIILIYVSINDRKYHDTHNDVESPGDNSLQSIKKRNS